MMTVSQEVQKALDLARKNHDLVQSVDLRQQAMQTQINELTAKIQSLPVGNVLSDDDKAALAEMAGDLSDSISTLTKDATENTGAASQGSSGASDASGSGAIGSGTGLTGSASTGTGQIGTGGASGVDPNNPGNANPNNPAGAGDQSTSASSGNNPDDAHQQDAQAASQAKPLAGTGA